MPAFVSLTGCNADDKEFSDFDKAAIIGHGIHYIFQTVQFTPDFYNNPVQLIKSSHVPGSVKIQVNGRSCELIDELSKELYQEDPKHPIPFVKVIKLNGMSDHLVQLDVEFPSIQTVFYLKIRHQPGTVLEVIELSEDKRM